MLASVARTGLAADRAVPVRVAPVRPAGGTDRARAGAERFTGTKRAAGPKLTADVIGRADAAWVVTPGMSARADGADPPTELASYARHRWIAGCDRCRAHLIAQCSVAGFTPKIAFTTDDFVAVQALVAADLGVSTLAALCLRAARHPGIKTVPLPGTRRYVYAVRYGDPPDPPAVTELMDALHAAAERPRPAE